MLRDDRVHFFHQGAPWLAIEATGGTPPYGLLILRRNTKDLSDPGDWRRLSEYRGILNGYHQAVQRLSEWTREQIKDFEQKEGVGP